jgi:hypothetical protein
MLAAMGNVDTGRLLDVRFLDLNGQDPPHLPPHLPVDLPARG